MPSTVKLGTREMAYSDDVDACGANVVAAMPRSGPLVERGDYTALQTRLASDGYLYLDGLIPREDVLTARHAVLRGLAEKEGVLDIQQHGEDAVGRGLLRAGCGLGCLPFLEGQNQTTHAPEVLGVLEHARLRAFFEKLFSVEATGAPVPVAHAAPSRRGHQVHREQCARTGANFRLQVATSRATGGLHRHAAPVDGTTS